MSVYKCECGYTDDSTSECPDCSGTTKHVPDEGVRLEKKKVSKKPSKKKK
jgi:hypothetical protein